MEYLSTLIDSIATMILEGFFSKLDDKLYKLIKHAASMSYANAADRFHLFKYITKICRKRSRKEVFASLEANDTARFEAYVETMKEKYPHPMKQIVAGAKYIENQWDYARASLLRPDIRSSTETHVSHIYRYA